MIFIHYPKCSSCRKVQKWLDDNQITYTARHTVEDNPSFNELKTWQELSGMDIKKFFNTSGILYREMKLKDALATMTEEEKLKVLASNGMLVKRPIIISNSFILIGFKIREWENKLLNKL